MLLVAYLRDIGRRPPTAEEKASLGPMITVSDNDRADGVYARVGDAGCCRVAQRAHMRHFATAGYWASAHHRGGPGALLPARGPARAQAQPGIRPPAARLHRVVRALGLLPLCRARALPAFFKGGWRSTASGRLVHEVALFQHGGPGSRWPCSPTATPRTTTAPRPCVAWPPASSPERPRRPAAPRPVRPSTRGPGGRARRAPGSAWTRLRQPPQPHRPAACPATAARGPTCSSRRPGSGEGSAPPPPPGHGLLVLDAYRPPAPRGRSSLGAPQRSPRLVGTYIASRSRHNLGSAVDLTLVRLRDGRRLRMGTGYDDLGPRAHARRQGPAPAQPARSQGAMERHGFTSYWREWWHFEHRLQGAPQLDLTLGCPRSAPR